MINHTPNHTHLTMLEQLPRQEPLLESVQLHVTFPASLLVFLSSNPSSPTPLGLCPPPSPSLLPLSLPLLFLLPPKVKGAIEGDQVKVVFEQVYPFPVEASLSQLPGLQLHIQLLQSLRDIVGEEGCVGDDVTVHDGRGRGCWLGHASVREL